MESKNAFLSEPTGRLLLKNAVPAVMGMLVTAVYHIVDGAMVGRRLGPDALAAINISYPLIALFVALAVMIGVGGNARIAVLLGAGRAFRARKVFSLLVVLGCALSLSASAIVLVFGESLSLALGAANEARELSMVYLGTLAPFFMGFILSFILEQSMRNDGKAGLAGAIMASGAVLNIALDYLFLFVLDFGIAGAAMASGISISLSAAAYLIYFGTARLRASTGLAFVRPRWHTETVQATVVNGSSELFSALALGVVTLFFNRTLMAHSGTVGVAAFAVVQYLLMLGSVIFGGLATGAQPIIGQNYGAGLHARVGKTLAQVLIVASILGALLLCSAWLFAERMAAVFVAGHTEAVQHAAAAFRVVAWALLFAPAGTIGAVFFTSLERPLPSLLIAAARTLALPLPALLILPHYFGVDGIWLSLPLAEAATAALTLTLLAGWTIGDAWKGRPLNVVR